MADDEHGGPMPSRQREHAPLHERADRGVVGLLRHPVHRDRGVDDDQHGPDRLDERDDLSIVRLV